MTFSANKFVNRMFRRIANVVWDPLTGTTGLKTPEGIFTIAFDAEDNPTVTVNPIDMSMALPGFATITAHDDIKQGDIIVGDTKIIGWVVDKKPNSYVILDHSGMTKQYTPPKVAIMGQEGALVVRNLLSLTGGQGGMAGILPFLMMSGGDDSKIEKLLPFLLMQAQTPAAAGVAGAPAAAANPMAAMLPFLLMQGGLGGNSNGGGKGGMDPMMLAMMMGGMSGGAGGMNPMMLLAMTGQLGGDDTPELGTTVRRSPPPLGTLSRS